MTMKVLMIQTYRNSVKELYNITRVSCQKYCYHNNIDYIGVNLSDLLIREHLIDINIIDSDDNWYKFLLFDFVNLKNYNFVMIINYTMMFTDFIYNIKKELIGINKGVTLLNKPYSSEFNHNFIIINSDMVGVLKHLIIPSFVKSRCDRVNKYCHFVEHFSNFTPVNIVKESSFIFQLNENNYQLALGNARNLTYGDFHRKNNQFFNN